MSVRSLGAAYGFWGWKTTELSKLEFVCVAVLLICVIW